MDMPSNLSSVTFTLPWALPMSCRQLSCLEAQLLAQRGRRERGASCQASGHNKFLDLWNLQRFGDPYLLSLALGSCLRPDVKIWGLWVVPFISKRISL